MNKIIYILFLTICISGCKKDTDENSVKKPNNSGQVKTETITEYSGVTHTLFYEYNTDGRLSRYTNTFDGGSIYRREFTETDSKLSVSYYENSILKGQHIAYLNAEGCILSENRNDGVDSIPFWYNYDSNGFMTDLYENWQVSQDSSTYFHTRFAILSGNIITQYHTSGFIYNYEYYDDLENTQGIYQIKRREMGGLILYPEYYGKPSENLLKYKILNGDTLMYEYVFDRNGRVSIETTKHEDLIRNEKSYTYY